jgi:hypothetical protein
VSVPPVPLQPETLERSGKATEAAAVSVSEAVAFSANEPEPPCRSQSVVAPVSYHWAPAPVTAVGAAAAIVGYYLLFNASYFYWDGGAAYGPRHLGAALPFLALGLAPLWDASRFLKVLLMVLAAWGAALAAMAVSTLVVLPESVMSPVQEVVWPAFARGQLALNSDLYRPRPVPGVLTDGVLGRGAWNLGMLAGLPGHLSLLPLGIFWATLAAVGYRLARARNAPTEADAGVPAEAFRLPVGRPPTLG